MTHKSLNPEDELTHRIVMAQKDDPSPGDFVNLVAKDLQDMEIDMSFKDVKEMRADSFKALIKKKTKDTAFKRLKYLQSKHSKIRSIKYDELRCQPYMTSSIFTNEEVNLLHSLRSRSIQCKVNFRGLHGDDLSCPLCTDGSQDDQPHILTCNVLRRLLKSDNVANSEVKYDDIFGKIKQQKEVTVLFGKLLKIRKQLIDEQQLENI